MRSRLTGAIFTVVLLLFSTCPALAQTDETEVGADYLPTLTPIADNAKVIVARSQSQLRRAVRRENKRSIKLASKLMKHAMFNSAVTGELVTTLRQGGKIKRRHARGCRTLNTELASGLTFLFQGKFSQVNTIMIKVEQIVILQPQPVNLNMILSQFTLIQQQITIIAKEKKRGSKQLKRLQTVEIQQKRGSKRRGSQKGGAIVVKGSKKGGAIVVKGSKKGGAIVVKGSKKGGTVVVTPPVVVIPPVVVVPCDGIIAPPLCWKCEGGVLVPDNTKNPGIPCYACSNGVLTIDTSLPCDDGNACTEKDTCSSFGVCIGQPIVSPVAPCQSSQSQSQTQTP